MKQFVVFSIILLAFAQCKTPKTATSISSESDNLYRRTFHSGVRYKSLGQTKEAIRAFDSCFVARPTDDAAAFGLAQCYLMLNDKTNAAKYTELASKLDKGNRWYTQELAYMYYEQGRFEESAACFKQLVEVEPRNVDWWFGYGEVLKRTKKYSEAINAYNKMQDQTGLIPEISIEKFNLYIQLKQPEKGINEIQEARKLYPNEISLIGTLVDYYFNTNQMDKGQAMLEELVKADPQNGRAFLFLGELYARQNRKADSYEAYSKAFTGQGVNIDQKVNVLLTFYETQFKVDPEVVELAKLLVEQHPDEAKAHSVLADLYLQLDQKKEALAEYKKALEFDNTKYPIWNQVLLLEYEFWQFEELYKDAKTCVSLFPTMANVYLLYAIACNQVGKYGEAIEASEIGKELVIGDKAVEAEFYAQLGEANFMIREYKTGIVWYEKAILTNPANLLIKNNYATRLALTKTDIKTARELINAVLKESPNNLVFQATEGLVLLQEGKYKEALTILKKVNETQPNERNYVDYLGDAYFFNGETNSAVENWKKAKELGAKNKSIEKKISERKYVDPIY